MNKNVLWSHKSDEWTTPQYLFDQLNDEFDFDLDPCSTKENHKCNMFYTKEQDGLKQSWGGCRVFCNPPYSQIAKWVEKAYHEGQKENTIVVLLIPARTDTRYFHNYIYGKSEIRFIKGRLKFSNSKNNAPFPSMIVVFRGKETRGIRWWERLKQ